MAAPNATTEIAMPTSTAKSLNRGDAKNAAYYHDQYKREWNSPNSSPPDLCAENANADHSQQMV